MARPRKLIAAPSRPLPEEGTAAERYIRELRAERTLFNAKKAAEVLRVGQDRFYEMGIEPDFQFGERQQRWTGHALADFLDRRSSNRSARASYLTVIGSQTALTSSVVAAILGLHSDVVPFLGLEPETHTIRGRTIYQPWTLVRLLKRYAVGEVND